MAARAVVSSLSFATAVILAAPVVAHHSATYFDMDVDLVHENATVVEFQVANPHGILVYTIVNDEGEAEQWDAELPSANFSRRGGVVDTLLNPGDTVKITGWPGLPTRTRERFMRLSRMDLDDGSYATFTAISAMYTRAGED
ncbi:MAG: DUF6152 family protein [Gammaproteobacteria bacterium]